MPSLLPIIVHPVRILTRALIIRYGLQTTMGTSPGALLSPGVLLRKAHRVDVPALAKTAGVELKPGNPLALCPSFSP